MTSDLKPSYQSCKAVEKEMVVLRIKRYFKYIDVEDFRIPLKGHVRLHL